MSAMNWNKILFSTTLAMALMWHPFIASEEKAKAGDNNSFEKATFAGGCFWCMEPPFEKLAGVRSVISGYIGGTKKNATYQEVSAGGTGHTEAVEITFDPKLISYEKLLDVFWRNIDPTTPNRQFVDEGSQYRSGIFYHSIVQKTLAEKSKSALQKTGRFGKKDKLENLPLVTEITAATEFFPAEEYHQDYYKKNPIQYKFYRYRSGRDQYLTKIWGGAIKAAEY